MCLPKRSGHWPLRGPYRARPRSAGAGPGEGLQIIPDFTMTARSIANSRSTNASNSGPASNAGVQAFFSMASAHALLGVNYTAPADPTWTDYHCAGTTLLPSATVFRQTPTLPTTLVVIKS